MNTCRTQSAVTKEQYTDGKGQATAKLIRSLPALVALETHHTLQAGKLEETTYIGLEHTF